MVAQLREKPGGAGFSVAVGDFSTTRVEGTFSLAFLIRNTIMNLTTQKAQVACFENVAAHLQTGGLFLIEVVVPNTRPLEVFNLTDTHVGVDEYDQASQACVSHHFRVVEGGWERRSIPFRAVSPAELDLMAQIAGMRLRWRWDGWDREPFTPESTKHVSVWETSVSVELRWSRPTTTSRRGCTSAGSCSRTSRQGRSRSSAGARGRSSLRCSRSSTAMLVGSGFAGLSDAPGRGFVAPRVLPEARRRGVGTALLERLGAHVAGLGVDRAGAHVDDDGSRAFAERFGFEEIDRQVEQVWQRRRARGRIARRESSSSRSPSARSCSTPRIRSRKRAGRTSPPPRR